MRRSYETALSPLRGPLTDPSRRLPATEPSTFARQGPNIFQRDIRPGGQTGALRDTGRTAFRPTSSFPSMYAPPTVSPSGALAIGTMISQPRPFSSGSSAPSSQPPSPYLLTPSAGMSPMVSEPVPRSIPPYVGGFPYPSPQQPVAPQRQHGYAYAGFPRPSVQMGPPLEPPSRSYGPQAGPSDLQLPPILPAPPGTPLDPAIAQQQRQIQHHPREGQQPSGTGTTRQPDSKRPKMDIKGILGPRHD